MKLAEILDRPIAYHRVFVTLTGSVKAAIMLSQAMYWQKRAKQKDGWWYKTADEWQEETGLTRHEQDKARKDCEKYLKCDLRGVPARNYWKVDEEAILADLFSGNGQSSLPESGKQDFDFPENINRNAETTTETTTINPLSESDFQKMSIEEARKVPELRLYAKATDFFPGSLTWFFVYDFIRQNNLTEKQIHDAAVEWALRSYQKTNIKGILEWARDGIPLVKGKSNGNSKSSNPKSAGTGRQPDQNHPQPSPADLEAAKRVRARQAAVS